MITGTGHTERKTPARLHGQECKHTTRMQAHYINACLPHTLMKQQRQCDSDASNSHATGGHLPTGFPLQSAVNFIIFFLGSTRQIYTVHN
jgi:hypothetical protein